MDDAYNSLDRIYNALWTEAADHFARGVVETDPFLLDRDADRRLGLTVIVRPNQETLDGISGLVRELAGVEPDQHYYGLDEVHVTVLSLFTATERHAQYLANTHRFKLAVETALRDAPAFTIRFRGVTASKSSVMVQGYPLDNSLEGLRASLRQSLADHGLGAGLDERYRIATAHCTIMRLANPPRDLDGLAKLLDANRARDIGETRVRSLLLVQNDWYMSRDRVSILAEYPLTDPFRL